MLELLILGVSGGLSLLLIAYSVVKFNNEFSSILSLEGKYHPILKGRYIARKKELEYMRDMLQKAIVTVYREYEEGKLSSEDKEVLASKFRDRLLEVENELKEVSLYAELESLEREYEKIVKEYESKKRSLESKINKLREKIGGGIGSKIVEGERTAGGEEAKAVKRARRETSDLSSLIKEVTEMLKKMEE